MECFRLPYKQIMKARLFTLFILVVSLTLWAALLRAGAMPTKAYGPEPQGRGILVTVPQQAQNVELVGQISGVTYAVTVQGNYACIGVGPRLVILDVSDPAQPTVIGQTDVLPGVVQGVAVAKNYAYVADGNSGLRMVDISDPAAPTEAGFYDTPGDATSVAVARNYAYVADGGSLRIVDISNPAAPNEAGFCDTPEDATSVAVAEGYAYIADGGGLRIMDISDPAAPSKAGFYATPGAANGVAVAGNYVYVADWDSGLIILRFLAYRLYLPLVPHNYP